MNSILATFTQYLLPAYEEQKKIDPVAAKKELLEALDKILV